MGFQDQMWGIVALIRRTEDTRDVLLVDRGMILRRLSNLEEVDRVANQDMIRQMKLIR